MAIPPSFPHESSEAFARFQMCPAGGFWAAVDRCLEATKASGCVIVTDHKVFDLHSEVFPKGVPIITVGVGEQAKSFQSVETILSGLMDLGLDRQGCVVAIGGGVVCDMTAFAASIWLRGVGCILCPTTLLAQVDAGVGGKSAINFRGGKNLVGSIRPALNCICDPHFLTTLSSRDLSSGLAEVVKMAVLYDRQLFEFLVANAQKLLNRDEEALSHAVQRSLTLKARVVALDPLETGIRKQLNFGHTLGHALEAVSDLRHGEAISLGMQWILKMASEQWGFPKDQCDQVCDLLHLLNLPTLNTLNELPLDRATHLIGLDKKRRGNVVTLIVPKSIGSESDIELIQMNVETLGRLL